MQRLPDVPLNQFTLHRSLFRPVLGMDFRSHGSFVNGSLVNGSFVNGSYAQTRLPSQSRAGHNTTTLAQVA
jgi:hypothetical protein